MGPLSEAKVKRLYAAMLRAGEDSSVLDADLAAMSRKDVGAFYARYVQEAEPPR